MTEKATKVWDTPYLMFIACHLLHPDLVEAHVLPHVICSSVIQGKVKTRNIVNRFVNLTRTEENKLFVNAAQMVTYDVMATNGVLHVIDAVLVPDEGNSLHHGISTFSIVLVAF